MFEIIAPIYIYMCAKLLQLCPTLCDPNDFSLPGSFVQEILQARILEWVAVPSSRGFSLPRDQIRMSYILPALAGRFFTTRPPGKSIYICISSCISLLNVCVCVCVCMCSLISLRLYCALYVKDLFSLGSS